MNASPTPVYASLAPMAGYTDTVFREICGRFGASAVTSEMISAVAMTYGDKKTAVLSKIAEGEPPVTLQLFGHEPSVMAKAADILLSGSFDGCSYATPPVGIDINMGCPVHKIVSSGDGSALMKNPPLAAEIISAVKDVCVRHGVPLSVKFRLGWDERSLDPVSFAVAAARAGADILTLHCRTKEQMYAPVARPLYCRDVRDALDAAGYRSVKLIGNGDVDSLGRANEYLALGCDGVAVGRAALGNPWLFAELQNGTPLEPSLPERVSLIGEYVTRVVGELGEERGVRESRSRAAYLLHGLRGSAKIRDRLNHAATLADFLSVLNEILIPQ